jgi:hypothetical protein
MTYFCLFSVIMPPDTTHFSLFSAIMPPDTTQDYDILFFIFSAIMPPDTTQDYDIHLAHAVNDLQEFGKNKTLAENKEKCVVSGGMMTENKQKYVIVFSGIRWLKINKGML